MFFESTYYASPHIEDLLKKEVIIIDIYLCVFFLFSNHNIDYYYQDVTLVELLDDDEILQEYKSQNKNLIH